jgi:hypothetical protein
MNTIENQQVKSNEPMTTWAHGWRESTQWSGGTRLHPLKSHKIRTSNPQMKGKTSTKCDLTVESVIGQLNGHHFIRSWREKTKRTQPKQQHNALMNLASSCMVSEAKPAMRGGSVSWVGGKTGRCSGWRWDQAMLRALGVQGGMRRWEARWGPPIGAHEFRWCRARPTCRCKLLREEATSIRWCLVQPI